MAKILDMPKLSPTMEEGVLVTWHKNEGDSIAVDDLLAEVETDKATMEFRAFDKGTLLKILAPAGSNVKLGQAVAIVGNAGEDVADLVAKAGAAGGGAKVEGAGAPSNAATPDENAKAEGAEAEEGAAKAEGGAKPNEGAKVEGAAKAEDAAGSRKEPTSSSENGAAAATSPRTPRPQAPVFRGNVLQRTEAFGEPPATESGRPLASPYVRKQARERGIDLTGKKGSGEHGRIELSDLDALGQGAAGQATSGALARPSQTAIAGPALAPPEVRPLSPMRKAIARRLVQSKQTVPHFYLTIDVDAEPLVALRERINADLAEGAAEGARPPKVSFNDLVIKGVAAALARVPECNAQYTDEAILVHKRIDVSVAVAIPDGLVTPVVRNADQKSVVAIANEVRELAARARQKKLKPEEMSDGTFSVSNLGMFGIDAFSAVINPPEGAILAVGQVRDEPVIKDGAVVPGKKLAMTLSCDHRVVDGAVGAAFLAELRSLLERPMRILTG